jgi:hypothetical protein
VGRIVHHGKFWLPMSALGQKQTSVRVRVMSALPPKADIRQRSCDVRFVPKADILHCGKERRHSIAWRSMRAARWRDRNSLSACRRPLPDTERSIEQALLILDADLEFLCSGTSPIAKLFNHFAPRNRMKFSCVHVMICRQKTPKLTVVRIKHNFRRVRTPTRMK